MKVLVQFVDVDCPCSRATVVRTIRRRRPGLDAKQEEWNRLETSILSDRRTGESQISIKAMLTNYGFHDGIDQAVKAVAADYPYR
jgi:hypothetical protein